MSVKEPWEVFEDELRRQIGRHRDAGADTPITRIPEAAVPGMSNAVANVVMEHLTDVEGLGAEQALEVTKRFFAELGRESSEPIGRRLERVWKKWREG